MEHIGQPSPPTLTTWVCIAESGQPRSCENTIHHEVNYNLLPISDFLHSLSASNTQAHCFLSFISGFSGLEISREPNCIFISFIKVLCIANSTSLGSLQKFEGVAGVFKGALGSQHPLISSPDSISFSYYFLLIPLVISDHL